MNHFSTDPVLTTRDFARIASNFGGSCPEEAQVGAAATAFLHLSRSSRIAAVDYRRGYDDRSGDGDEHDGLLEVAVDPHRIWRY